MNEQSVEKKRFHDNPSGVITDTKYKKHWLPKDSWGDLGQWRNFSQAKGYILTMNQVYAGGYSNWRLPTREEAENFYTPESNQMDWDEEIVHIDTLFVKDCANFMWINEVNEKQEAARIDLRNGEIDWVDQNIQDHQAARLIRDISV
jgi:hypothetical protein